MHMRRFTCLKAADRKDYCSKTLTVTETLLFLMNICAPLEVVNGRGSSCLMKKSKKSSQHNWLRPYYRNTPVLLATQFRMCSQSIIFISRRGQRGDKQTTVRTSKQVQVQMSLNWYLVCVTVRVVGPNRRSTERDEEIRPDAQDR